MVQCSRWQRSEAKIAWITLGEASLGSIVPKTTGQPFGGVAEFIPDLKIIERSFRRLLGEDCVGVDLDQSSAISCRLRLTLASLPG